MPAEGQQTQRQQHFYPHGPPAIRNPQQVQQTKTVHQGLRTFIILF